MTVIHLEREVQRAETRWPRGVEPSLREDKTGPDSIHPVNHVKAGKKLGQGCVVPRIGESTPLQDRYWSEGL